jgi:hypothetical protein
VRNVARRACHGQAFCACVELVCARDAIDHATVWFWAVAEGLRVALDVGGKDDSKTSSNALDERFSCTSSRLKTTWHFPIEPRQLIEKSFLLSRPQRRGLQNSQYTTYDRILWKGDSLQESSTLLTVDKRVESSLDNNNLYRFACFSLQR